MNVSRTRDILGLTAFVALCFGVSVLGGRATVSALAEWYPALRKPPWTPPGWVFGPVWTCCTRSSRSPGGWPGGRAAPASGRSSSCSSWR